MADNYGCTTLWWASYYGHVEVIKWMITLKGYELDLDKKGKLNGKKYTVIEIARERNRTEVVSLLERLIANPTQTRHELRVEFGLVDACAAELFAVMVFLCDDFLRIKEPTTSSAARFFNIVKNLPMELQMVLCYLVFGSSKENIKSKDSEPAFKSLARTF
jgi:hypothetical protein